MQALEQTSPTKVTIKRKKRTYVKKTDNKKSTKTSEETSILKDMIDYDEKFGMLIGYTEVYIAKNPYSFN